MKHLLLLTVLGLSLLLQVNGQLAIGVAASVAGGFFLGPIAVGAGLGALFLTKGLILGAALSSSRSRQQSYSRGRRNNYETYQHYNTDYNSDYSRTPSYYYSSEKHGHGKPSKRSVVNREALDRVRREIRETFDESAWYLEMVEKDQDDCTKRLVCEIAARNTSGRLYGVEAELSQAFGLGNFIDVSSPKAVFDMAAQSGKLMGVRRCEQFYKRCETPVTDILRMINKELEEFTRVEKEMMKELDPMAALEAVSEREKADLARELGVARQVLRN